LHSSSFSYVLLNSYLGCHTAEARTVQQHNRKGVEREREEGSWGNQNLALENLASARRGSVPAENSQSIQH